MACARILGRTLLFVLVLLALLIHAPAASCLEPVGLQVGNAGDEGKEHEAEVPNSKEVIRDDMMNPARNEARFSGHALTVSHHKVPGKKMRPRYPGVVSRYDKQIIHDSSSAMLASRVKRQNPKFSSLGLTAEAYLQEEPPPRAGVDCARPPTNPTVVVGIVGGALAFFLVVVLTIVFCSYRNHPPSDVRKRLAEMYAYMSGIEDFWFGIATTGGDFGSGSAHKYDGCEKGIKKQLMV